MFLDNLCAKIFGRFFRSRFVLRVHFIERELRLLSRTRTDQIRRQVLNETSCANKLCADTQETTRRKFSAQLLINHFENSTKWRYVILAKIKFSTFNFNNHAARKNFDIFIIYINIAISLCISLGMIFIFSSSSITYQLHTTLSSLK